MTHNERQQQRQYHDSTTRNRSHGKPSRERREARQAKRNY